MRRVVVLFIIIGLCLVNNVYAEENSLRSNPFNIKTEYIDENSAALNKLWNTPSEEIIRYPLSFTYQIKSLMEKGVPIHSNNKSSRAIKALITGIGTVRREFNSCRQNNYNDFFRCKENSLFKFGHIAKTLNRIKGDYYENYSILFSELHDRLNLFNKQITATTLVSIPFTENEHTKIAIDAARIKNKRLHVYLRAQKSLDINRRTFYLCDEKQLKRYVHTVFILKGRTALQATSFMINNSIYRETAGQFPEEINVDYSSQDYNNIKAHIVFNNVSTSTGIFGLIVNQNSLSKRNRLNELTNIDINAGYFTLTEYEGWIFNDRYWVF